MKSITLSLLTVVAVVASKNIITKDEFDLKEFTYYDYHNKVGIPLAEKIRYAEAQGVSSRVTGGTAAILGEIPYQVGLIVHTSVQSVCGGVIVSSRRVITAAHCWWDGRIQATSIRVVAGTTALFSNAGQSFLSSIVDVHQNWNPNLMRDNIAMIYLPSALRYSNTVSPAVLPYGNDLNLDFVGHIATASGFGRTADGPWGGITTDQILTYVHVPVITNNECLLSYPLFVTEKDICTSGAEFKSICAGDAGSPLVVTRNDTRILIGMASYVSGSGCERGSPAVYTRVTSYLDWINERLNID